MSTPPEFDHLWDFDDPAGTERVFRGLLKEQAGSAGLDWSAQLKTQIARTLGLQRRFEEAQALLDEVERGLVERNAATQVRYLLERGRVLNSSGHRDRSRPLFHEAWTLAREAGHDDLAVDAAHMIGIVAPPDDPDQAHDWNQRALDLAESSSLPRARKWRGSLHNNIGWTCFETGDFEGALQHFEEALAARRELGDANLIRIGRWCVAKAMRVLGKVEEALAVQRDLLAEHERAGSSDGYVHEEVAECLLALGRDDEARPHFARAHEILSQDPWLTEREPRRIERLRAQSGESGE